MGCYALRPSSTELKESVELEEIPPLPHGAFLRGIGTGLHLLRCNGRYGRNWKSAFSYVG